MIRYYFDEHVSHDVARALRLRGIDVLTSHEAGMTGRDDEEHLALAHSQRRVLVTYDQDFPWLVAQGHLHSGLAFIAQPISIGQLVRVLERVHRQVKAEEAATRTIYIP